MTMTPTPHEEGKEQGILNSLRDLVVDSDDRGNWLYRKSDGEIVAKNDWEIIQYLIDFINRAEVCHFCDEVMENPLIMSEHIRICHSHDTPPHPTPKAEGWRERLKKKFPVLVAYSEDDGGLDNALEVDGEIISFIAQELAATEERVRIEAEQGIKDEFRIVITNSIDWRNDSKDKILNVILSLLSPTKDT